MPHKEQYTDAAFDITLNTQHARHRTFLKALTGYQSWTAPRTDRECTQSSYPARVDR